MSMALMIVSVIVALSLLPLLQNDKGRGFLAIACACSFYLYTDFMIWALAVLIFVQLVRDDKESERFALWPAVGATAFILIALMPLAHQNISPLNALLSSSVTASASVDELHSWAGSAQSVIAMPILETYIIFVWLYGGLAKPKVGVRTGRMLTALFYSLMHFQPVGLIFYSLTGWILARLYEERGFWSALTASSLVAVLTMILSEVI